MLFALPKKYVVFFAQEICCLLYSKAIKFTKNYSKFISRLIQPAKVGET